MVFIFFIFMICFFVDICVEFRLCRIFLFGVMWRCLYVFMYICWLILLFLFLCLFVGNEYVNILKVKKIVILLDCI